MILKPGQRGTPEFKAKMLARHLDKTGHKYVYVERKNGKYFCRICKRKSSLEIYKATAQEYNAMRRRKRAAQKPVLQAPPPLSDDLSELASYWKGVGK